ncbi:hypothetical protein ACA910_013009 [Epithemia clementina (nom. ined.)]
MPTSILLGHVQRQVEQGLHQFYGDLSCLLLGQESWGWGIGLSKGDWQRIYLLRKEHAGMLHSPFWNQFATQFSPILTVISEVEDLGGQLLVSLVMIEGDSDYVRHYMSHERAPSSSPRLDLVTTFPTPSSCLGHCLVQVESSGDRGCHHFPRAFWLASSPSIGLDYGDQPHPGVNH